MSIEDVTTISAMGLHGKHFKMTEGAKMKNDNKKSQQFKISEGTSIVLHLSTITVATVTLFLLLHFGKVDLNESLIGLRAVSTAVVVWIVTPFFAILFIALGMFKKTILIIRRDGIGFRNNGYLYEYEWEEIEYIYEHRKKTSFILFIPYYSPTIVIKPIDTDITYEINLDEYYWTLLPVRWAFRRIAKDKVLYYTKRQWKKHLKEDSL